MMHMWAKWYVKAAAVVVAAVLGAFVSGSVAHERALHIYLYDIYPYDFYPSSNVILYTLAWGIVGFIGVLVVVLFGYSGFRIGRARKPPIRLAMVLAMVLTVAMVLWGASFVWKATRHLNEDQVIALAEGVYARAAAYASCKGSLATKAHPPAIWRAETWTVTVAGPCGLKTFVVYDATGDVGLEPTPEHPLPGDMSAAAAEWYRKAGFQPPSPPRPDDHSAAAEEYRKTVLRTSTPTPQPPGVR